MVPPHSFAHDMLKPLFWSSFPHDQVTLMTVWPINHTLIDLFRFKFSRSALTWSTVIRTKLYNSKIIFLYAACSIIKPFVLFTGFLDASTYLYKRVCTSVVSVRPSVRRSVRNAFFFNEPIMGENGWIWIGKQSPLPMPQRPKLFRIVPKCSRMSQIPHIVPKWPVQTHHCPNGLDLVARTFKVCHCAVSQSRTMHQNGIVRLTLCT